MKIDLTGKNAAIGIFLGIWLLFFASAITFSLLPGTKELANDIWKLFGGANLALAALLNSESKSGNSSASGGSPENPTK